MFKDWHNLLGSYTGAAFITVALLPLAALAVRALTLRRRATGTASAWRLSLAEVGIVYGTVPWVWVLLLPNGQAGLVPGRIQLVPLQDLFAILADGPVRATGQIVINLLIFTALGFFAPQRFAALASVPRILA